MLGLAGRPDTRAHACKVLTCPQEELVVLFLEIKGARLSPGLTWLILCKLLRKVKEKGRVSDTRRKG